MKAIALLCAISLSMVLGESRPNEDWWKTLSLYQIYPRSFKDSDGDGVGDLKGITSKLRYLLETNVDALWLSPIYPSPMVDFGYDISDFLDIDPVFGTMEDFEELLKEAHALDMKVVLDFVPNHSSDKHEWFQKSLKKIEPYTDYFVWHKGKILEDGTVTVPNNWVSVFGGPAWTWREERQAYYLHQFAPEQPDLNYNNENVIRDMKNVLRFWLNKGVDGFRVDAIPHLCEDQRFLDEPLSGNTDDPNDFGYTEKIYTKDQPRTYEMVKEWKSVLDEYKDGPFRVMMMEAYANISMTLKYYDYGAFFPFNFGLITDLDKSSTAADFKYVVDRWMSNMPSDRVANWVAGNHDRSRLVTRYGFQRAQAITLLTLMLPGVGVTYNGEEIGMEDTWISWEDTKDPQGCNAGKEHYAERSRDPARTPFQWDDSTSAGFSTNPKTWLPVNDNYKTLNLAAQKADRESYYSFYRAVSQLKKSPIVTKGTLVTKLLNDNVFAFSREHEEYGSIYSIINFGDQEEVVDLSVFNNVSNELKFYYGTTGSGFVDGYTIKDIQSVTIPKSAAAIFYSIKELEMESSS